MKLYRCKVQDESMEDWEYEFVAVMESEEEQETYYRVRHKTRGREDLLVASGYDNSFIDEHYPTFFFPYKRDGYCYADAITQNEPQAACDADYWDFEYIEPTREGERK